MCLRCRPSRPGPEWNSAGSAARAGWEDSTHGCLHGLLGPTCRLLPPSPCAPRAERLAPAAGRRPLSTDAVLAGDPEPGDPGAAGPLPALDAGLPVDAAQPAA